MTDELELLEEILDRVTTLAEPLSAKTEDTPSFASTTWPIGANVLALGQNTDIPGKPALPIAVDTNGNVKISGGGGGGGSAGLNLKGAPFNAKGDGTTDDTTAIKAWIAAGVAQGGGKLFAPRGNYKHTTNLPVHMAGAGIGLEIYGEGRGVTIFTQATANTDSFVLGANGAEVADNMYLHDFTIVGTKYVLRLNNVLSSMFERLGLQGGVVGLYIEGQCESLNFLKIDIVNPSQNCILTGQLNGGTGLIALDLPEMQKCTFDAIRLYGAGSTAVVITAGNLGGQQSTQQNTFRHMLFESNNHGNQWMLDHCNTTVIEMPSFECDTLDAGTYTCILIGSVGQCGSITIRNASVPGHANDGSTFAYGIKQLNGILTLDSVITGEGVAATTADISINDGGYMANCTVTDDTKLAITSPEKVVQISTRNASGVVLS